MKLNWSMIKEGNEWWKGLGKELELDIESFEEYGRKSDIKPFDE